MAETAAAPAELRFADARLFRELLGQHDEHVKALERQVGVRIDVADSTLTLHGDPLETELVSRVLLQLYGLLESGYPIYPSDVDYALRILSSDRNAKLRDIFLDTVFISAHKRVITPKSVAQKEYIDAIRNFDIVFGIGPAGTGKCVAGSSLVLTTRGLVPIAALGEGTAPGEYRPIDLEVASLSGRARASHVYNGGHSRTLRLRTRLGREIEVTPEHPLLRLRTDGVSVWQHAEELRTGDHVAVQQNQTFGGDTAEITAIDEGEADVYDLTVPGSHAFCANGFVNHNTYLAMAMAVAELMKNSFSRIILTRPAVEAGEKLGFLPGDLVEKVNPYLRPLHDALHDIIGFEKVGRMMERGIIEIAPIAFMRGRTLNDSFIILDEAQNTTPEQMKMFLTRIGFNSKAVINGDVTQVDLPQGRTSGLREAQEVLSGVEGIKFFYFDQRDVVRHSLVQKIVTAYDAYDKQKSEREIELRAARRQALQAAGANPSS